MNDMLKITLVLLYLSGWEEETRDDPDVKVWRSWKGYLFDVLNDLNEKGFIHQFMNQKSVLVTDKGLEEAKKLLKKIQKGLNE